MLADTNEMAYCQVIRDLRNDSANLVEMSNSCLIWSKKANETSHENNHYVINTTVFIFFFYFFKKQ